MRYMGSKARFAKHILPIILAGRQKDQLYIEPFIGGANSFCLVPNPKLGGDSNEFLIAMWREVSLGWSPPEEVSVELYNEARQQSVLPASRRLLADHIIGFIGSGCSFGGKWWGGYARGGFMASGLPRVYARESARAVCNQMDGLQGSEWFAGSYESIFIPDEPCIIYCDPPYASSTLYKDQLAFDHTSFWNWAENLALKCHVVFVSEYKAPDKWESVWSSKTLSSLTKESRAGKENTEHLFSFKNRLGVTDDDVFCSAGVAAAKLRDRD